MAEDTQKAEKSELALREEAILKFWQENNIFEKSVEKEAPGGSFVFYDGPPFATGLPHYGHILASAIKDAVPRYQTMRGKRVERRWGWDCHGLPIENIVEKDLGLAGKKQIEELGINVFNEHARSKVLEYVAEWKKTVDRIGRWVNFDGSYKTMDNTYMESVWWALSEFNKKGLVYEGTRVLPYCPRCETPLAQAEIAMDNSYKDITDISVFIKFELIDEPGTYVLAWTTTPWTLPGNTALAVGGEVTYVKAKKDGAIYIVAKDLADKVLKSDYEITSELQGQELVGKKYKPLFDHYAKQTLPNVENGWHIYAAPFVTTVDGTGVVHIAPAFGEDDMTLAKEQSLPIVVHVSTAGIFKDEFAATSSGFSFLGIPVKPKDDHQSGDILMVRYLAAIGALYDKLKIIHSYPHCFRCETPLYYYAIPAWFIKIQDIKSRLLELNESINWVPGHLKHGRFEKSMAGAPDWNISRNRFWATPLPIWKCAACNKTEFAASLDELKVKQVYNRNDYLVMRHGEAEHNVANIISSKSDNPHHLTAAGREKTRISAELLKNLGINFIYASDFVRTKETATIVADVLGLKPEQVIYDLRLREVNFGNFEGRPVEEYREQFAKIENGFEVKLGDGESFANVKRRIGEFIYDINDKHQDQKILIITHESLVWLLDTVTKGSNSEDALNEKRYIQSDFLLPGEYIEMSFVPLPHNASYELDLHRPYIDSVKLGCVCGGEMSRIPEVVDCWLESASMPFAAEHFPFSDNKFESRFPAQFVAEYIAQTRTWFYYMHVVSTILFNKAPFENVITTGTVLAEDGQKMSKSKGNFPDPWLIFDQYGVDAVRFYLLSSPIMKSEDLNFSEQGVGEVYRKIITRLWNTCTFYNMYAKEMATTVSSDQVHVLDQWILARLNQTTKAVEEAMEAFELDRATRPIDEFIDDLSNWYLRRSRDRFKSDDATDQQAAIGTTRRVLLQLAQVMAPFTPFISEMIHQGLNGTEESVHLTQWPVSERVDAEVIAQMQQTRDITSLALERRMAAGIKIRQPLSKLKIKSNLPVQYLELIGDELNVKEVVVDASIVEDLLLDTTITPELESEGRMRELVRQIQDLRKQAALNPDQVINLLIATTPEGEKLFTQFDSEIKKITGTKEFRFGSNDGNQVKVGGIEFMLSIAL
jgi:isoleucyl-tRNA synthetase